MIIEQLRQQQIAILGLGETGLSCARFCEQYNILFTAFDEKKSSPLISELDTCKDVIIQEFINYDFSYFDTLIVSPGIALTKLTNFTGQLLNDVELFAQLNKQPVIAITGTNGKSTVTRLVTDILCAGGYRAIAAGNIGLPVLELLHTSYDIAVLELSSFQLELLHSLAPLSATILNISPDHLDHHASFSEYQQAKHRIYHHSQYQVINSNEANTHPNITEHTYYYGFDHSQSTLMATTHNEVIYWQNKPLISLKALACLSTHQIHNYLAALALITPLNVNFEQVSTALQSFKGLPHRLETIKTTDQKQWINDSKATNVGAAIAAINGIVTVQSEQQLILLVGGVNKNADLNLLLPYFQQVSLVIAFGADREKFAEIYPKIQLVDTLNAAVILAKRLSSAGDIILLSPACASFDEFKSYAERGEQFIQFVQENNQEKQHA